MEDRLEIWLELLAGKLDRLIELGENVERASRSQGMPEEWGEHEEDHFAGAGKMVSEGPDNLRISIARELEGYRLVNDSDIGKVVEVQNSTADPWMERTLLAIDWGRRDGFLCNHSDPVAELRWCFARIKNEEPAKEPPKKWRILEPGEVVCSSDLVNAKSNPPSDPPNGLGWIPVITSVGATVCEDDPGIFARLVADEPAKEAEHPAGPKPGPGEGGCEPTEQGIGGDIEVIATARWIDGGRDRLTPADEPAKEPEPEYREPVLPADLGKWAEFSHDGINWIRYKLCGCHKESEASFVIWSEKNIGFRHCRIRKES